MLKYTHAQPGFMHAYRVFLEYKKQECESVTFFFFFSSIFANFFKHPLNHSLPFHLLKKEKSSGVSLHHQAYVCNTVTL